ncbi:hypothetical protein BDQ12DRAFT_677157 [Crucibulum laeve]|uniref:Enoyl reductase (ER) domain-containing protein n=1 Tax=Crucibulum laeve TaxID=68775 RepID=A0A5C3MP78_9AGAR|nr:hypothetical protein BDQ12DRAFT_677157 [Crucibulum laeve]
MITPFQRAWVVTCRGTPEEALSLRTDWPVPQKLEPGEVLVKVEAGALNPAGWKMMRMMPNFVFPRPHVAEFDFAGTIANANGTELFEGDAVYGFIPVEITQKTRQGALAEYIRIPEDYVVPRSTNLTAIEASGLAAASQTAYQAIYVQGQLSPGQIVFINGGSSAVGAFVIQLAKGIGAKVVATASAKNEVFVRKMGADEFIDYTKLDLAKYLVEHAPSPKFNLIFDAVGLIDPSLYTHSEAYLQCGGIFITSGPLPKNTSAEIWTLLKTVVALVTPAILGGTRRKYECVAL